MPKEIVINITPGGVVSGMHRDELSLAFLGKQKIERASDIRFDEVAQNWRIHLADGHTAETNEQKFCIVHSVGGFASYNEARDFEVRWLNECMKMQVAPLSTAGQWLGGELYEQHTSSAVAHA